MRPGRPADGIAYLEAWLSDYDRRGLLHGHLSWHLALWALEQGDRDRLWRIVDADVVPGAALGLPINILTDTASIYYRASLAGETVSRERWHAVSAYAQKVFPKASLDFIEVHAALAHAMAGEGDALRSVRGNAAGPAADLVRQLADASMPSPASPGAKRRIAWSRPWPAKPASAAAGPSATSWNWPCSTPAETRGKPRRRGACCYCVGR